MWRYFLHYAQDGIEVLNGENIDLILTDVQMPDIDGFEFIEYLKV